MSRPWRPKPFLRLIGPLSSFQATVLRVRPLADSGSLVVIGAAAHRDLIEAQMAEIGVEANVLLEPVGRNTTAAIAAAAGWIARRAADAVVAVFPSDHHITDNSAFEGAIRATLASAVNGAIVTLGVPPTSPSTAYGYIRPSSGDGPVWPTVGFEEKADPVRAARLIAAGALWNSGIFVAAAGTICAEVRTFAPSVADAVDRALGDLTTSGETWLLGVAFADAPPIAFDRAVMEKTTLGAVLPELAVIGAWAVGCFALALKLFRWK